jgi:hypothetical protein
MAKMARALADISSLRRYTVTTDVYLFGDRMRPGAIQ